jgi:oxygen-independent coproporphyrinogen-3 oxidase
MSELTMARGAVEAMGLGERRVSTVFFGGGTPTLLAPGELMAVLDAIEQTWGLAPGAEVTVEANPDSIDEAAVKQLAAGGVTRLSVGMQSAVPHVLATLGRTHRPAHVRRAVEAAADAGIAASVDLIYGTPGETLADWEASLTEAVGYGIVHMSIYALTLEPHTPLARRIGRGEVGPVDADEQAAKYELADALLAGAGLTWYEISNFAASPADRSRHNLGYWTGGDWWGLGPGAHSGFGGPAPVRWWNVAHPQEYAARLARGETPEAGREVLDAEAQAVERVMLGIRVCDGLPLSDLPAPGRASQLTADGGTTRASTRSSPNDHQSDIPLASARTHHGDPPGSGHPALPALVADGLIHPDWRETGRVRLTLRGRLLADAVTRALIA